MTVTILPNLPRYLCPDGHESYSVHACLDLCPHGGCGQPVTRVTPTGRPMKEKTR